MEKSRDGFIKLVLIVIIVLVGIVGCFLLFKKGGLIDAIKDKSLLTGALESITVYSANGSCDAERFDVMDNYFSYNPHLRCSYDSNLPLGQVVEKYKDELQGAGWTCVRDEYLYQRAAGKRKAYTTTYLKGDFALDLYLTNLPEGTIWNGKQIEVSIERVSDDRRSPLKGSCNAWIDFEQ